MLNVATSCEDEYPSWCADHKHRCAVSKETREVCPDTCDLCDGGVAPPLPPPPSPPPPPPPPPLIATPPPPASWPPGAGPFMEVFMHKYSMTQHELRVLNGYHAAIMLVPLLTVLPLLAACQLATARARRHAQLQALRSAGQTRCKPRQNSGRFPAPGRSSPLVQEQPRPADMACLPDSFCQAGLGPSAGAATHASALGNGDEAAATPFGALAQEHHAQRADTEKAAEAERASLRSATGSGENSQDNASVKK